MERDDREPRPPREGASGSITVDEMKLWIRWWFYDHMLPIIVERDHLKEEYFKAKDWVTTLEAEVKRLRGEG